MPRIFQDYADAGFLTELLPVIPPHATILPQTPAFANLSDSKGKVPGRSRPGGWVGFGSWTAHSTSPAELLDWQNSGASIGMQGRRFPCIDIDADHAEIAKAIQREVELALGPAPVRFGSGARRILPYAASDLRKRRLAFQSKEPGSRGDKIQAVELLATGQQYVVEGIHPGTGKPYFWQDEVSPVTVGAAGLQTVTAEQIDDLFNRLECLVVLNGYEVLNRSKATGKRRGETCQGSLIAPSLDAVERALGALANDFSYDVWIAVGMAVKAACGPEHDTEGYALWEAWSLEWAPNTHDVILEKWESMRPPFSVGWPFLAALADEHGDGSFFSAHEDFEAVEEAPPPDAKLAPSTLYSPKVAAMFDRYVWIEGLKRVCDMETGALLDRDQFNVRNRHIGDPTNGKECAWAVLIRERRVLQTADAVTYRPGAPLFVDENLPGLTGRCINTWRGHDAPLPDAATDDDVRAWLDHCAFVIPDERERQVVFDWLAWIIQNPGEKPNWALLIGSTVEGMGKDLMLEPVRVALGGGNVREITAEDLGSGYTDFLAGTRLLLVGEMELHERKAMMNRLKPFVAAPPYTLRVNIKFQPQYAVPNTVAVIFFTNMDNALAISAQDRRYFVTWNDGQPRDAAYYERLVAWYAGGGAGLAARWLLDRDVSQFKAKGRAPDTAAKAAMRLAALPALEATIHDGIANREGPFARRLVTVGEVAAWVADFIGPFRKPSPRRLVGVLKTAGAIQFDRRPSLGAVPNKCRRPHAYDAKQVQLFAMPGDVAALELLDDLPALRDEFWAERQIVHEDFMADEMFGDVK